MRPLEWVVTVKAFAVAKLSIELDSLAGVLGEQESLLLFKQPRLEKIITENNRVQGAILNILSFELIKNE
jgi:hypothetical protein